MATKVRLRGRLLVFEGPDGVGKTTISQAIARELKASGISAQLMTFPGKESGSLGKLIYDVHHEPDRFGITSWTASSKQALHVAAHLDAIERRLLPALRDAMHVVLDRFWWSTWVYGMAAGVDRRVLHAMVDLEGVVWGAATPAIVVLLRRSAPIDRQVSPASWRRLREEYDRLADREGKRYPVVVVNNDGPLEATISVVREAIAATSRRTRPIPQRAPLQVEMGLFSSKAEGTAGQAARPRVLQPRRAAAHTHLLPLRPTVVYDTYWRFAAERQHVFFRRLEGAPPPWTEDPILATYKFTNAYRASDRVSQYLIRHVIYREDLPSSVSEVFYRILLFKTFNKIETWQLLEEKLGPITAEDYSFSRYDRVLRAAMADGKAIYSAAYIMPSGGSLGHDKKHQNHLELIERMMRDRVAHRLADAPNMQRAFETLRAYPTIGDFLAYQYVTDINYSDVTNFTEMEFVIPGPGALDGIRKCFDDLGGLNEPEVIKFLAERQSDEFERLGLRFRDLWGRPLQLIDCQNIFCEVDKYSRVRHPEVQGLSGRTRIKQKFMPQPIAPGLWYPPKWKINERIGRKEPPSAPASSRA